MKRLLRIIKQTLSPPEELTSRTIVGGLWTAFTNSSDRVLQILLLVVLARLLSPTEFGLFGIATLTLTALKRFSRLGFDTALIQRQKENVDAYLDTVFTLRILRGVIVAGLAFVVAPLVAAFFSEPLATPILRVVALSSLFQALYNPGTIYFRKDLEFHKEFVLSFSRSLSQAVVAIGYALLSPTVWALVAGSVAGSFVQLLASYAIHEYRPRLGVDRQRAGELINYGKWIYGSSAISYFYSEGDDIFVGRVLGSGSLGAYRIAYRLSNAPATEIAHTVSNVAMPAYSKIQDDKADLREGFHRVLRLSSLVSVPFGIGIAVVAPVFVPTFLGDQWDAMIVPMQLLAVFGALRSVRTCASPLFRALGQPDFTAKIHAVRLAAMIVTIYPLTAVFGLAGTALSVLLTSTVGLPIAAVWTTRLLDEDLRSLVASLGFPVVGSLLMGVCALAVRRAVTPLAGAPAAFITTVFTGVAVYVLFMIAADQYFEIGLQEFYGQLKQSL